MPKKQKQFTPPQILAAKSLLSKAHAEGAKVTPVQSNMTVALNRARTETHNDRVYEIYPAVLLREMVVHGTGAAFEKGASFIPGEELEATAFLWSDTSIMVNHPAFGLGLDQFTINDDGLGRVFFPWYHSGDNELRAELWIDQKKAELNNRWVDIKAQAENGTLELSTGYLLIEIEEKEGSFEGVEFATISRGIIPLHLALLPDDTGACSNSDGCGLNIAANKEDKTIIQTITSTLEAYGLKKISKPGGEIVVALNSQTDKEIQNMNESTKLLVAALVAALSLTEEQAAKLIGSCDCDDLTKLATANLTALQNKAEKVAGLQTDVGTLTESLKVHTDKEEAQSEALRGSYLKALGFSDDVAAIKETKTEALKAMAANKKLIADDGVSIDDAAVAAMNHEGSEKTEEVSVDTPSTNPRNMEK